MHAQLHARYVICSTCTLSHLLTASAGSFRPLYCVPVSHPPLSVVRLHCACFRFALVSFRRPSLCSLSFRFVDRPFALSRFVSWTVRPHRRPLRHRSLVFVLLSFRFVYRPSMLSAFIIHVCSCRFCIPLPLFDDCSLLAYTFHRFCYVNVPR
jgi:hypothetical protein